MKISSKQTSSPDQNQGLQYTSRWTYFVTTTSDFDIYFFTCCPGPCGHFLLNRVVRFQIFTSLLPDPSYVLPPQERAKPTPVLENSSRSEARIVVPENKSENSSRETGYCTLASFRNRRTFVASRQIRDKKRYDDKADLTDTKQQMMKSWNGILHQQSSERQDLRAHHSIPTVGILDRAAIRSLAQEFTEWAPP